MNAGDEMVRGLGDVLRPHFTERDYEQGCTLACGYDGDDRVEHLAHALAAHVLGLVTAGKAEALREAAKELPGFDGIRTHGDAARWLRDRADGLAGEAS